MPGPVALRSPVRHWSVAAFGAWNAAIWGSRIRNIVEDDQLSTGSKAAWMVPAVLFGVGGVMALVGWAWGGSALERPVAVLAVGALAYWPVRTVAMLGGGHDVAFVAVHLILAAVSVGLAVAVLRRLGAGRLFAAGARR